MPLKWISLEFAYVLAALCLLVVACDAFPRLHAAFQRRRRRRAGVYGVVVDRRGRVVGTYLDPFGHPWRAPRVHDRESPWAVREPDGQAWAWEGFGVTEEEAYDAANRLRRRHLRLLPDLYDGDGPEEDSLHQEPYLPR